MARARSARVITSRMTGPRRLPTWTVPDGVFESLTTCGPSTLAASSSAQSTRGCPSLGTPADRCASRRSWVRRSRLGARESCLADLDDRVREVPCRDLHDDLLALLAAEQRASHGRLVRDPALRGLGLGRADDEERLGSVLAVHLHRRPDLDVVGRGVLVDQRRVLDHRLEGLDPALDERLLVLGVLVLRVLGEVAVLLGVVNPLRDLGTAHREHLVELRAELVEAVLADVGGLAVHASRTPEVRAGTRSRAAARS